MSAVANTVAGAAALAASVTAVAGPACFRDWPAGTEPEVVGLRVARHFAENPPDRFSATGSGGASMQGAFIPYPISVLWANSIELSRRVGDKALEKRLAEDFVRPFLPGGEKNALCPDPCHVDLSIFGTTMLEAYLSTGSREALALGEERVHRQWAEPREDDYAKLPESMRGGGHTQDFATRQANWKAGLSGQSRFWTDDMFMIGFLQTRGARAALKDGRPDDAARYIARAAHEAVCYLDRLQLKDGPAAGLFHHAPVIGPQCWGRGNGWMAAGLTVILDELPASAPEYAPVLAGYRRMMAALLRYQRANGFWGQLVDHPESWDESSATAIFTFAFIRGVQRGWLDAAVYGPAARKGYLAVVGKLDDQANVADVCVGTDCGTTVAHYLGRAKVSGAPHGQAGLLLCVNALLNAVK